MRKIGSHVATVSIRNKVHGVDGTIGVPDISKVPRAKFVNRIIVPGLTMNIGRAAGGGNLQFATFNASTDSLAELGMGRIILSSFLGNSVCNQTLAVVGNTYGHSSASCESFLFEFPDEFRRSTGSIAKELGLVITDPHGSVTLNAEYGIMVGKNAFLQNQPN